MRRVPRVPAGPSWCAVGISPVGYARPEAWPASRAAPACPSRAAHRGLGPVPWISSCDLSLSENFGGEREIGLGSFGGRVPKDRRHAVARRFGEAHVPGHESAIDLVAEVLLELLRHVLRERVPGVVHRAQKAGDLELGIEVRAYPLDGGDEVRQTFERVVLALHRNEYTVRRRKPVHRKQAE